MTPDLAAVQAAMAARAQDFDYKADPATIAVRVVTDDGWPFAGVAADLGQPEAEVVVSGIAFEGGEVVLYPAMALARAFATFDKIGWPSPALAADLAIVVLTGPDGGMVAEDPAPTLERGDHGGGVAFRWLGRAGDDRVVVLPDEWGNATILPWPEG